MIIRARDYKFLETILREQWYTSMQKCWYQLYTWYCYCIGVQKQRRVYKKKWWKLTCIHFHTLNYHRMLLKSRERGAIKNNCPLSMGKCASYTLSSKEGKPSVTLAGAVLDISLSSFQTACCRELLQCARGGMSRRVSSDTATQILRRSPIFLRGNQKKRSSLDFLSSNSKQSQ